MANGIIYGVCTGSSGSKYDLWIEWSSVARPQNNTSTVYAYSYLKRNDGYSASAYNLDVLPTSKVIGINGEVFYSAVKGIDTRDSATVNLCSAEKIVQHDSSGYASINISCVLPYVTDSLYGGTASGTATLDMIDTGPVNIYDFNVSTTQDTATFSWSTDAEVQSVMYTINGGRTWEAMPQSNTVSGLVANTIYGFGMSVQKPSNGKRTYSKLIQKATSPVLITDIVINGLTVNFGEYSTISPLITPENASITALTYTGGGSVCKIQNNAVYAINAGTTTVRATSTDGSGVYTEFTVTVKKPASGIITESNNIVLPVGATAVINYSVLPSDATDKTASLSNSDNTIISLSGNIVTALQNGTSIVTVTSNDGGFTAETVVEVKGADVFYDYSSPPNFLNYRDVNNINTNMFTIWAKAAAKSISVGALTNVSCSVDTPLFYALDILQNTEYNLDVLQAVPELFSAYYKEAYGVGDTGIDKKELWRIIQVINDMFLIITGKIQKWQILKCSDGIPVIDGKEIILRGDYIA